MRTWILALAALMACNKGGDSGGNNDTDTDADSDADTDTDSGAPPVWDDRHVETAETLYSVYTGGTGAWVAGTNGAMWRLTSGDADPLESGVLDDLNGIWGYGDGDATQLVSVGGNGTIVRYSVSGGFTLEDVGTANFFDVDGPSGSLTAVGWAGAYQQNGDEWVFENLPGNVRVDGSYVIGGLVFAVGEGGAVVLRSGSSWSAMDTPVTNDLHAVHGTSANDVWAVGERGTVVHWDSSAWTEVPVVIGESEEEVETNFWGVWCSEGGEVFVVGNNGAAYRHQNDAWEELPTGVDSNLYAVWGSAGDNVWAVGNRGAVVRYTGGSTE